MLKSRMASEIQPVGRVNSLLALSADRGYSGYSCFKAHNPLVRRPCLFTGLRGKRQSPRGEMHVFECRKSMFNSQDRAGL